MIVSSAVLNTDALERIAASLKLDAYNVSTLSILSRGRNAGRHRTSLVLRPNSHTPEALRSTGYNGRRIWAVNWEAHRRFMVAVLERDPDAEIDSALARYRGRAEFDRLHTLTGSDLNRGYTGKVTA